MSIVCAKAVCLKHKHCQKRLCKHVFFCYSWLVTVQMSELSLSLGHCLHECSVRLEHLNGAIPLYVHTQTTNVRWFFV